MHITENCTTKPIKRTDGSAAVVKISLPAVSFEEDKHARRNQKILDTFFHRLSDRVFQKAEKGICDHYMLSGRITYLDDRYISMFFEVSSRSRGKSASYAPFSATLDRKRGRFCTSSAFCSIQDIKSVSEHLHKCRAKYSFYLSDGCVVFYEKRPDSPRLSKVSIIR